MHIVTLYDENVLLADLQTRTIDLIHATTVIDAIKKLVTAHEIISLNLEIQQKFKKEEVKESLWDKAAFKDLNRIRIELMLFHRCHFCPMKLVDQYSNKMLCFFRLISSDI